MRRVKCALVGLIIVSLSDFQITTAAQTSVPQWQIAAGGKMAFEVASIRPTDSFTPPSFPMSPDNAYRPNGGLLTATFPLMTYITFAYKLFLTSDQRQALLSGLPKWVGTDRYAIQARAAGTPTNDQMRLMMQSLLAERFKLAVHFEKQQVPVFALTPIRPRKLGPQLRPHAQGPPCDDSGKPPVASIRTPVFLCESFSAEMRPDKTVLGGSRNNTMALIAATLPSMHNFDRPVIDQTGLVGTYDFTLEWTPEAGDPFAPQGATAADFQGTTFLEALKDQLGLQLESTRAEIDVLVVDHVERPTEN
jgi:bla regulator protein BlaR1